MGFNSDEAVHAGQAAGIAVHSALAPYSPVFRAHPLFFQTVLSLVCWTATVYRRPRSALAVRSEG